MKSTYTQQTKNPITHEPSHLTLKCIQTPTNILFAYKLKSPQNHIHRLIQINLNTLSITQAQFGSYQTKATPDLKLQRITKLDPLNKEDLRHLIFVICKLNNLFDIPESITIVTNYINYIKKNQNTINPNLLIKILKELA